MSLEFKRKVREGDKDLRVIHRETIFEATKLNEMPYKVNVDSEKWSEEFSLGYSIVKRTGSGEKSAREEKEQLVR